MFDELTAPVPDSLMLVAKQVREDRRPDKLDLGVGVYRDASGRTPVVPAVAEAASILLQTKQATGYLPPAGDPEFVELLTRHVLDPELRRRLEGRIAGVQAPDGTRALRLAAELIAASRPDATVWLGIPTWPNHAPILHAAGLKTATYDAIDLVRQRLRFDGLIGALERATPGDVVLLQGCCHNPTGIDFSAAEWSEVVDVLERRALIPLIDFAYQGLGVGSEEDASGCRLLFERLPEAMAAIACSKSFGLYRERVGLLLVKARTGLAAAAAAGTLQTIVRSSYSNPPAYGAALVRTVLERPELTRAWRTDLDGKRARIAAVRNQLALVAAAHKMDLGFVARQYGLFSMLPIGPQAVGRLGIEHAIHIPITGRVNVAGLNSASVPRFVDALRAIGLQAT